MFQEFRLKGLGLRDFRTLKDFKAPSISPGD